MLSATAKSSAPAPATTSSAASTRRGPDRSSRTPAGTWQRGERDEVRAGEQPELSSGATPRLRAGKLGRDHRNHRAVQEDRQQRAERRRRGGAGIVGCDIDPDSGRAVAIRRELGDVERRRVARERAGDDLPGDRAEAQARSSHGRRQRSDWRTAPCARRRATRRAKHGRSPCHGATPAKPPGSNSGQ